MKKYGVSILFLLLTVLSAFFINQVKVNYDLQNYLPEDSDITKGIELYQEEFGDTSIALVSFDEASVATALDVKNDLLEIDHVVGVYYIDTYLNEITYTILRQNLTTAEQSQLDVTMANLIASGMTYPEAFLAIVNYLPSDYQSQFLDIRDRFIGDGEMLFQIVFDTTTSSNETETAIDSVKTALTNLGYATHFGGSAISSISTRNMIESEVLIITLICVPLILGLLLIFSRSFFDIIIFAIVIGVSIVINLGTNVLLPDISFITKSMAIVLQIAISLDYVIFMINAYHQERRTGIEPEEALKHAKKKARKPIMASALTTGVSFLALIFMRFSIGFDIGIVFAKAIVISLLSTLFLLPQLIRLFSKALDKTTKPHRELFKGNLPVKLYRFRYAFLALLIVVLAGSIYVQTKTEYTYGASSFAGTEGSTYYEDVSHINDVFGESNPVMIILPKSDVNELALYTQLSGLEYVSDLQAGIYYKSVITDPLVLAEVTQGLYSDNYALIQFNLNSSIEGDEAFGYYDNIQTVINDLGISDAYILGETAIAYNIKEVVSIDYNLVLVLAVLAVMVIILITFRNFLMPILLPLVIVTSVFFTMGVLYLFAGKMVFLANLIVSAILLGVTIDYAILLSKSYMEARANIDKTQSIKIAIRNSSPSVITSAMLFSIAGLVISVVSSIQTISEIGLIIAVGAITSLFYVLIILPQLLTIFDKWIIRSNIKITR